MTHSTQYNHHSNVHTTNHSNVRNKKRTFNDTRKAKRDTNAMRKAYAQFN
jgi:hypothetical protein